MFPASNLLDLPEIAVNEVKRISPKMIKGAISGLRPFLASESPFKMMRNAFHFTLKVFFSRYLNFVLTFWSCSKTT